tara:strand:+ start:3772 stop:3954 length:183 start_codon:yes stop_codon:yes gene_type:complete
MTFEERDALQAIKLLSNSIARIANSIENIEAILQKELSDKQEWGEDHPDRIPDFLRSQNE